MSEFGYGAFVVDFRHHSAIVTYCEDRGLIIVMGMRADDICINRLDTMGEPFFHQSIERPVDRRRSRYPLRSYGVQNLVGR